MKCVGCEAFGPHNKNVRRWACAECRPVRHKIAMEKYAAKNPWKSTSQWKLHGLTEERWADLVDAQGGRCAGCGNTPKVFNVDHDHSIGCHPGQGSCDTCRRGLLCYPCNAALGYVYDNPLTLLALVSYLGGVSSQERLKST